MIKNGLLNDTLRDAALISRLQNDLGGTLGQIPAMERVALTDMFHSYYRENAATIHSLADVLMAFNDKYHLLTRIRKDLDYDEYTVALYGLLEMPDVPAAIQSLDGRLAYYSTLYTQCAASLRQRVDVMAEYLGDRRTSELIMRFVKFHEYLYQQPYQAALGIYAC